MQLFVSWSGDTAKEVGETFTAWLDPVLPEVKVHFSPTTPAGAVWNTEMRNAIQGSQFALLVVTTDNKERPWLMWEAGALSNLQPSIRVVPFLFHLTANDLPEPLRQLQAVEYRGDTRRRTSGGAQNRSVENAAAAGLSESEECTSEDCKSLMKLIDSMLDVLRVDEATRRNKHHHAKLAFSQLQQKLGAIRQPGHLELSTILRGAGFRLANLKDRRLTALNSFGFGAYTSLISEMVEFLNAYEEPSCDIFNTIQPRDYIRRALGDPVRPIAGARELQEDDFRQAHALGEEELRQSFPSVFTLAEFARQVPDGLRRVTVMDGDFQTRFDLREMRFLNDLMGAGDRHFVISAAQAQTAVDPMRLHRSDFVLWRCSELVVLTDYYPDASTLLVGWRRPNEQDDFIAFYEGIFDAMMQSHSRRCILEVLERGSQSDLNRAGSSTGLTS